MVARLVAKVWGRERVKPKENRRSDSFSEIYSHLRYSPPMRLACVFLTLFCIGCEKEATSPKAVAAPSAQPAASQPAATPPPATAAAAPAAPANALATSDNDKGTGRAELTELKRISGGMLMLKLAIVNTGHDPMSMTFEYTDPGTSDANSVSGITLVDPVNKKKYFVVRDGANGCLCATGLKDVKPGERITAWARFPAPPDDVQKMSVMIPHFPPIDEVAIVK